MLNTANINNKQVRAGEPALHRVDSDQIAILINNIIIGTIKRCTETIPCYSHHKSRRIVTGYTVEFFGINKEGIINVYWMPDITKYFKLTENCTIRDVLKSAKNFALDMALEISNRFEIKSDNNEVTK